MNRSIEHFLMLSFAVLALGLTSCEFRPVSAALEDAQEPYLVRSTSTGWRLDTRIPVPENSLGGGLTSFRGLEYSTQPPPGEASGSWVRQNTWFYPQAWGKHEEFWYGWLLLDLFSIDRGHHVSPSALESQGVGALFAAFQNDRFTAYYPPEVSEDLGNALGGTGLDSVFGLFFRAWPRDTLVAARVEPGSAAWIAGLRSEDRLLRFDGRWAATSFGYLADTAGHRAVDFEYLRPGLAVATLRITRSPHLIPTVFADTLPGGVGYISIGQFVSTASLATDSLFQIAASWLEANSKGTWILDLRGNGGGAISTAANIASALVPPGSSLIGMRERGIDQKTLGSIEWLDTVKSTEGVPARLVGRPILLLQDRHSASSSEILISALRENLGASIRTVGDTSFGKGIGQIYEQSPLGGFMAVTCLHIDPLLHPSYHKVGIAPDIYEPTSLGSSEKAWNLALTGVGARTATGARQASPNFTALDWNRTQLPRSLPEPLMPAVPGRPFPLR